MNKTFACIYSIGLVVTSQALERFTVQDAIKMIDPHSPARMFCTGSLRQWQLHNMNGLIGHYNLRNKSFVGPTWPESGVTEKNICEICHKVGHHVVKPPHNKKHHQRLKVESVAFTSDGLLKENVQLFINCHN